MPQTKEAIAHAKAAGVPIIVAINKMDKAGADPSRVRNELLRDEIQVEELGGDVQSIEVSATQKTNLDKLEEAILLQAELLELKANPDRAADGVVIEAKLDPGRGSVATVLVQRGTLKVGDVLVAGAVWGRVRRLVDDHGQVVESAGPAFPVEILGLDGTPQAGDEFHVVESEARAREIADFRVRRDRQAQLARVAGGRGTLEEMMKGIREGTAKELPVLIKADVQGSAEALAGAISRLSTDKVATRVVLSGVGGISEADLTLAKASGALIIGFNVRANPQAREIAKRDKIDIRYYSIIYKVTEDIEALMLGLRRPDLQGDLPRQRADPRGLPHHQDRQRRRLHGHGRHRQARRQGPPAARQRGDPRGHAEDAASLQGRGPRGPARLRVRHGVRELRRHEGRRRDRVLRRRRGQADPVTLGRATAWRAMLFRTARIRRARDPRARDARGPQDDEEHAMPRRHAPEKENRAPGQRQLRVGEEIRHLLAELLERGNMRDPDLRDATITVTSVDVSPDLRNAIAFVMPLGGKDTDRLLAALRRAAPWFRARVSEKAGLRSAPEIRFQLDRTFDEADKIGALLRRPDVARDIEEE